MGWEGDSDGGEVVVVVGLGLGLVALEVFVGLEAAVFFVTLGGFVSMSLSGADRLTPDVVDGVRESGFD